MSFDAFGIAAEPIAIAVGIEHRREAVSGAVDPQYQSGWFVGNYLPTFGSYQVTEGYIEALVPIIKGLDFNGAVRGTDYSTSGYVTTWKAGLTFEPISDIRFRVTRSRDIRAPNLGELYQAGASRTNNLIDPFNGNAAVQFTEQTTGNPNLKPETADTWGAGVVLQPRFLPGLGLSVDYFDISVKDGVGTVTAQTIVDRCFQGLTEYCASIIRSGGSSSIITQINVSPFNFASQKARGLDIEASYRTSLDQIANGLGGSLALRALATRYFTNVIDNGIDAPVELVGQNGPVIVGSGGVPTWVYRMTATYTNKAFALNMIGRGFSGGVYDNSFIECTSACPLSTIVNRTINDNHIDGAFYLDTSASYDFTVRKAQVQAFISIQNVFNRDPAIAASGPAGSAYGAPSTNQSLYDLLGRTFRVGLRFKL